MPAHTADVPTTQQGFACPGCGWMESEGALECRSCGATLPGRPRLSPALSLSSIQPDPPPRPTYPRQPLAAAALSTRSKIVLVAMAAALCWLGSSGGPVTHPPGILIPETPVQGPVPAGTAAWRAGDTLIQPLASYRLKARLLHRERYRWDAMSDLAPLDLGVGWGVMSDETNTARSEFSNTSRYLSWHYTGDDFPADEAARCIANMHLLPASDRVRDRLLNLRCGQLLQASGFLVEVQRPGLNPWTSSLTRLDAGHGACEIMWVESVTALP